MARLEVQDAPGFNTVLLVGPCHDRPLSDDVVLSVRHRTYDQGRSVLLSRARVRELRDWLDRWLADGWPGVPREEGPTSSDVIVHYREIAVRERIAADRARCDAARVVDAALALIPPVRRGADLAAIAAEQSAVWHRLQGERDTLEETRCRFVRALHDIEWAPAGVTADQMRKAAATALDRHNKTQAKEPLPETDAPVYQLDLLAELNGGTR